MSGDREHLVQRPRRADRLHAGGCLPLLHAHRDGRARARVVRAAQERAAARGPGGGGRARVAARVRTGLIPSVAVTRGPMLADRVERLSAAAYWELLMNLTKREVRGRYSQSLFGIGWAVAQPLATMAVFTLVFSRLGPISSRGLAYSILSYAARGAWVV